MKYMYWTIANAINSDYCDELVKRYRLSKEIATTELGNGGYDDNVRRSEVSWVEDKDVIDMIKYFSTEINSRAFGFDLYGNDPNIQFTEYNSEYKGTYDWHIDTLFADSDTMLERKLSIVVQLTDGNMYEGGDFLIGNTSHNGEINLSKETEFIKNKGTILAFPSFMQHKVTPVTSGVRNSLVSWIDGPSWR